jgi:hypothetical protein
VGLLGCLKLPIWLLIPKAAAWLADLVVVVVVVVESSWLAKASTSTQDY